MEAGVQILGSHLAEAFAATEHAGVVDEQVQRLPVGDQGQVAQQRLAAAGIGHVQRQHMQAPRMLAGQPVQRRRLAGVAAGRHHVPLAGQQLRNQFQSQAAIGPGHQAVLAVHVASTKGFESIGAVVPVP